MEDLFEKEQRIFDGAVRYAEQIKAGGDCEREMYEALANEYGRLLRQLRMVTKLSDMTTVSLNASKLDLLDKVHYDALTGIYNRRFMEESFQKILKSACRNGGILSFLMLDVDYFKNYNDVYGHSMGDECLKSVAAAIKNCITRPDDFAARYGGEEFAVILPNTDRNGACRVAERLLESVMALNIAHEQNSVADCVTVSIGVTTGEVESGQKGEDYIKRADKALYISKQSGRNQYNFISFKEGLQ